MVGGKALAESVFLIGGETTISGEGLKRGREMREEEEDKDSWATSLANAEGEKDKMKE